MRNRVADYWDVQSGVEKTLYPYSSRFPLVKEVKYNEDDLIYSFVAGVTVGEEFKKDYLKTVFKNNLSSAQNKCAEFIKVLRDKENINICTIFIKAEEINIFHAIYVIKKEDILNKAHNIYSLFSFFKSNSNGVVLRASLLPNVHIDRTKLISDGYFWQYKHEI